MNREIISSEKKQKQNKLAPDKKIQKIAVIHGQSHIGSTCRMTHEFLKYFKQAKISEFFLPQDLNHFCLGCYACIHEEERCPFYEEKRKILSEIEQADLLVFTTPTYCLRASGAMKSFLDLTFSWWMSHRPREEMFSKTAVIFSTAAGMGSKSAMKDIAIALQCWGVAKIYRYGRSVQAMNWLQVSEKNKSKIEKDMQKLASKIQKNVSVKPSWKTRMLFEMMRLMQCKGMGASKEDYEYWESKGWLLKKRPWKKTEPMREKD